MSDKISKLSQAIRLGATFRPQCKKELFCDGKSCALGAAYEAVTGIGNEKDYDCDGNGSAESFLQERFNVDSCITDDVMYWNDRCNMTREQIADRLKMMGY